MVKIPEGKPRELAPEGAHNAVCVQVIDLGTQPAMKEGWDDSRSIQLAFQLVDEQTSNGKAVVVYKQFGYTYKGNFGKLLKSWLGVKEPKSFDPRNILGKAALVTVVHRESKGNGNTYDNVDTISALQKNVKVKRHTEKLKGLFLEKGEFDQEVFDSLSDYLKQKIAGSPEYSEVVNAQKNKGNAGSSTNKKTNKK
jgi:hypothetical protein